eukprot:NODE_7716_length_425_cov_0.713514.p3 GENE.NODE_7716_length_425_cov_0.713514~~NODE_7716_length_425_cov_0.713514.p3  ORF type:complete len:60 (-),score=0.95 NODE_7716_length_425_cov_0.713514:33-212(-)
MSQEPEPMMMGALPTVDGVVLRATTSDTSANTRGAQRVGFRARWFWGWPLPPIPPQTRA